MAYTTEELGRLIARAHYQAWRLDAPPFDLTPEELAAILPNLIRSGSAGIVWHRVKPFREKYGAMAYALEAATDAQIAHNQRVEEAVVECVSRLRAYGIEPVLIKGLALAKLYPEGIVRPAGDIDLVVHKEEFAAAHAILHDSTKPAIPIDVDLKHVQILDEAPHAGFSPDIGTVVIGGRTIRTISPSDNLSMLVGHFLKHSGAKCRWLVDIALFLEAGTSRTDHRYSAERHWIEPSEWMARSELGLQSPIQIGRIRPTRPAPLWLVSEVRCRWVVHSQRTQHPVISLVLADPTKIGVALTQAWLSPLEAIFRSRSGIPRYRKLALILQTKFYVRQLMGHMRFRAMNQISSSLNSL